MDNITYKRSLLQKKRLELAIDESEIKILDLQAEIEKITQTMVIQRKALQDKTNEIGEQNG